MKPGLLDRILAGVEDFAMSVTKTAATVARTVGLFGPTTAPSVPPETTVPTPGVPMAMAGQGQMLLIIGAVVVAVLLFSR